jgi:hypothetical protein
MLQNNQVFQRSPTTTTMPNQPGTAAQIRLNNITGCLTVTANTLEIMAHNLKLPFLEVTSRITQSLLTHVQVILQ